MPSITEHIITHFGIFNQILSGKCFRVSLLGPLSICLLAGRWTNGPIKKVSILLKVI